MFRQLRGSIFFILALGIIQSAQAVCVNTLAEYEAQKKNFPTVLQSLPCFLAVDKTLVTAGLKIRAAGDRLKLEGAVWKAFGVIEVDDPYILNACFENDTLVVKLENGKSYKAKITSDSSVEIQGFRFDKTSEPAFAQIVNKVKAAKSEKTTDSSQKSRRSGATY